MSNAQKNGQSKTSNRPAEREKKNPLIKLVVVDAQWLASAFKPTEGKKIHSFVLVYGRRKILHLLYNILPRLTFNY